MDSFLRIPEHFRFLYVFSLFWKREFSLSSIGEILIYSFDCIIIGMLGKFCLKHLQMIAKNQTTIEMESCHGKVADSFCFLIFILNSMTLGSNTTGKPSSGSNPTCGSSHSTWRLGNLWEMGSNGSKMRGFLSLSSR